MKRTSRRLLFHEMVDFPRREQYFGGCVRKERSVRHPRDKKDNSKCSYRRVEKKPRREEQQRFFIKKETLLLEGAGVVVVWRGRRSSAASITKSRKIEKMRR